jgi:myo-inositol-1-phosphate synthase
MDETGSLEWAGVSTAGTAGSAASPECGSVGVWLVGARGSVATTTIIGALALRAGLADAGGLVGLLPPIAAARAPGIGSLVFGGHDIGDGALTKRGEQLAATGVIPPHLLRLLHDEIEGVDARIRPGIDPKSGQTQGAALERLVADLHDFRETHGLERVVVIDLSSTEPPVERARLTDPSGPLVDPGALAAALAAGEAPLSPSSAYAVAAVRAGCPFVSFTPSPGPRLPVFQRLADAAGLPWAGSDGKTGETLLKSALAPMFANRALRVRAWGSYNMLGGGDGATLGDPVAAASKTTSKSRGLQAIVGYPVEGPVHIDNVPSLGDWKVAMDHVSFEGFLGVKMSLQFTWTGADSALAAPLVIDLARLTARAHEVGLSGPLGALAFFFKDPVGTDEHGLSAQWDSLVAWCAELGARA